MNIQPKSGAKHRVAGDVDSLHSAPKKLLTLISVAFVSVCVIAFGIVILAQALFGIYSHTTSVVANRDFTLDSTQPVSTVISELPSTPMPIVQLESATPATNSQWITYQDPHYGYSIAIPCWWEVTPTLDVGGAMSLQNFDDAFLAAHSTRGEWTNGVVPAGALNLNVMVFENMDPNAETEELIRQISSDEDEIVEMTKVDLNDHASLLVEFKNTTTTPVTFAKAYYLRFQPDKLMIFSAFPNELLDSSDLQGIIHSIAFNKRETVNLPAYPPSAPLIKVPAICNE